MHITSGANWITLHRNAGDKRIPKESTVAFHLRNLLNQHGGRFVRIDPRRYGLTDCRIGVADHKARVIHWHERYQIESASEEFNAGSVTFQSVREEPCASNNSSES